MMVLVTAHSGSGLVVVSLYVTFSPGGMNGRDGRGSEIHFRMSSLACGHIQGSNLEGSCDAVLGSWVGIGGRLAWLGPLPWTEQAGLVGFIPGSGKAFLPGLAFKPRQRGSFSLASLFCCPRALLSAWQKLI